VIEIELELSLEFGVWSLVFRGWELSCADVVVWLSILQLLLQRLLSGHRGLRGEVNRFCVFWLSGCVPGVVMCGRGCCYYELANKVFP